MSSRTRHKQCEGSLAFEHLDRDSSFHFVPFRMTSHREGYIAWLCSEPRPMVECEESLCHPEPATDGVRDLLFLTRNGGDCSLAWQEMLRYAQHDIRLGGGEILRGFTPQNDSVPEGDNPLSFRAHARNPVLFV